MACAAITAGAALAAGLMTGAGMAGTGWKLALLTGLSAAASVVYHRLSWSMADRAERRRGLG